MTDDEYLLNSLVILKVIVCNRVPDIISPQQTNIGRKRLAL